MSKLRPGKVFFLIILLIPALQPAAAQWQQVGPTGAAYDVTIHGSSVFSSIYNSGVYRSTDNGSTWTAADSGITDLTLWAIASINSNLYAGCQFTSGFRSTDNGQSWNAIGLSAPRGFVLHGDTLFAAQWSPAQVLRSTDDGATWSQTGVLSGAGGLWPILSAGSAVYVGGQVGGVYRTTNGGSSWTQVNNGITYPVVYALGALGGYVFAGTDLAGLFRSSDNGNTWTPSSTGMGNATIYTLMTMDSLMLAGTAGSGVFLSADSGATWVPRNEGLLNFSVVSLATDGSYVYASTLGSGIFRRPLGQVTSVNPGASVIPASFHLEQNYPNPFNPSTTISFSIPHTASVTLRVYNALGQEVAELANGEMEPGYYTHEWTPTGISSGVYFCRLEAGDFVAVRKLLLMK